jgi:acetylornithine/succinyldiaminopimelate/putrescine aminotransferase
MPIGAFVSSQEIMSTLSHNPILGHITTFGGHPVSCAASLATLNVILEEKLVASVSEKETLIRALLIHPKIKSIHGKGLLLALEFDSFEENKRIIDTCIENGVITDWFLFNSHSMRIAPPLTISLDEIKAACAVILAAI